MNSPEKQVANSTMVYLRPTRNERDEIDAGIQARCCNDSVLSLGAPSADKSMKDMPSQARTLKKVQDLSHARREEIETERECLQVHSPGKIWTMPFCLQQESEILRGS